MESVFGVAFDNFIILAASSESFAHGALRYANEDKIYAIPGEKQAIAACGPAGDRVQFCEYLVRNLHLNRIRSLRRSTCNATANYIRSELATSIRSREPYQVNCIFAGWDDALSTVPAAPALYWIDYLGTMSKVPYAAHGVFATFSIGILDRWYRPEMTLDEGMDLMKKAIQEVQKCPPSSRAIVSHAHFTIKVIDKDGVRDMIVPVLEGGDRVSTTPVVSVDQPMAA